MISPELCANIRKAIKEDNIRRVLSFWLWRYDTPAIDPKSNIEWNKGGIVYDVANYLIEAKEKHQDIIDMYFKRYCEIRDGTRYKYAERQRDLVVRIPSGE